MYKDYHFHILEIIVSKVYAVLIITYVKPDQATVSVTDLV